MVDIYIACGSKFHSQTNFTMKLIVSADELSAAKSLDFAKGTDTSLKGCPTAPIIEKILPSDAKGSAASILYMKNHEKHTYVARKNGIIERVGSDAKWNHVDVPIGLEIVQGYVVTCSASGVVRASKVEDPSADPVQIDLARSNLQVWALVDAEELHFVSAGEEKDLEICQLDLDAKSAKPIWQARNVKNDRLDLRVPINVTALLVVPPISSSSDTTNQTTIITGTKLGQLRIYDPKQARRPIADVKASSAPIACLALGPTPDKIIFSDTRNTVATFDTKAKSIGSKYLGSDGCVKSLQNYNNSYLVTGGLDRYVRVYTIDRRQCVAKIYTGTQVMALVVTSGFDEDDSQKRSREDADEDNDEFWNKLEKKSKRVTK